jgi:DNA-binding LacI/PurR family transcriptional regulator
VIIININDVAKEAGVSKSTVSSVFSGKRPISKEVREHVLNVAKRLNYKPNHLARSLAIKETKIIGLSMKGERVKFSRFHLSLLNGVLKASYENGYRVLVNHLPPQYDSHIQLQTTDPVDGQILLDPLQNDQRIAAAVEQNMPTVVIGRPQKEYESIISYVDNDNVSIAAKLTDYLITLGHKEILFLNSSEIQTVGQDRAKGYIEAFNDKNIEINKDNLIFKPADITSAEYGYKYAREKLSRNKKISAIIVDSDRVAQGVYNGLNEMGLAIPEDISVAAFSDDLENTLSPKLTSANLNSEVLGEEAAKILIEQCQSRQSITKRLIISSKLVVGKSTMEKKKDH